MASDDIEPAERRDRSYDRLLNRYVSVWLWSILFGTTTGVLYSFLSFRLDRWAGLAVVLVVPALLALVFALMAWGHLYWGLKRYLIPKFVLQRFSDAPDAPEAHRFAYHLHRALALFICAAAFRALASILELILTAAQR